MNELFGISMSMIVVVLAGLLVLSLLSVAWVYLRRRVIFRMGARNISRRRAQTALIVFGLMLSTLIVTAALGTGDTVDRSMTSEVYGQLGPIDQFVTSPLETDISGNSFTETIPVSAWTDLQPTLSGTELVDGASPFLERRISARATESGVGVPELVAMGIDPASAGSLGGLTGVDGETIDLASLPANAVVLSETAAKALDAKVGDTVALFHDDATQDFTVAAVAESTYLSGMRRDADTEEEVAGLAMNLSALQELSDAGGQISAIALSNKGDATGGLHHDAAVQAALKPALDEAKLGIDPLKQSWLDDATMTASIFTGLFLVVGLFSIAAGILLILLIFTMLAAERRSEMGMARAVGAQRSQLIQQFMSEGSLYALLAGLVGSALGVGVAYIISRVFASIFGDFAHVEPSISARSVLAGYCLGVVITFFAVVGSSWRISRLNIVAAVRDLPDNASGKRSWKTLLWQGLMVAGGVLLTLQGMSSNSEFQFRSGVSLLILAGALILRQLGLSSRLTLSVAGMLLLGFWLMPNSLFTRIFGSYDGDFEMFFVSGIFLVISATLVIMQNDRVLLGLISRLGSIFRSRGAALKLGVAYPGAARSRTGMTIAMFSLIVFSLVMIATINLNLESVFLGDGAKAGWDIEAKPASGAAIPELENKLTAGGIDANAILAVGGLTTSSKGMVGEPGTTQALELPITGMDAGYLDSTAWSFSGRAEGYATDDAILHALRTEPGVAVVDAFTVDGEAGPEMTDLFGGIDPDAKGFAPIEVQIRDGDGQPQTVRIIGITSPQLSSFIGIYASDATMAPVLGEHAEHRYVMKLTDPALATATASEIQSVMLPYGLKTESIQDQIEASQERNRGFFTLLQSFMGLGLIVGIAAIGVISFRNVIERRQQIGVLRAIGFQRGMVSWSFLIEAAIIVGVGVLSGTLLGIALARNLLTGGAIAEAGKIDFLVPWNVVGAVLALAVVASLVTTWLPARQAAGIAPAEALRYE